VTAAAPLITLAYSVDADDAFMFHALRTGRLDVPGLSFAHRRADTAALNRLAQAGAADVVAISAGAYPSVADRYQLLPHGASVGRGFGPVVVAPRPLPPADLAGRRVGIPGLTTTAFMVLRMIEPGVVPVEIPIAPFGRIFEAVSGGEVDAALLIHEGRLLYRERGLHLVVDLGRWWQDEVGLPLPLGVNVIRRALGEERIAAVSAVLAGSIRWALEHRAELIAEIAAEDRGDPALRDPALLDRYLSLYANADTAAMPADARRGIEALFGRALALGLIPAAVTVDWAP
jgi:1,4-dihydroxy-6-naphthoate synthase